MFHLYVLLLFFRAYFVWQKFSRSIEQRQRWGAVIPIFNILRFDAIPDTSGIGPNYVPNKKQFETVWSNFWGLMELMADNGGLVHYGIWLGFIIPRNPFKYLLRVVSSSCTYFTYMRINEWRLEYTWPNGFILIPSTRTYSTLDRVKI